MFAVPSVLVDEKLLAIVGGAVGALATSFLVHWLVRRSALKSGRVRAAEFGTALAGVSEARVTLLKRADSEYVRRLTEAGSVREQTKAHAESIYGRSRKKNAARRVREIDEATEKTRANDGPPAALARGCDRQGGGALAQAKAESEDRYAKALADAERKARETGADARSSLAEAERTIAVEWRDGQDRIGQALNKLRANGLEHFPDWNSPFWYNPPAAVKVPAGVRFGTLMST